MPLTRTELPPDVLSVVDRVASEYVYVLREDDDAYVSVWWSGALGVIGGAASHDLDPRDRWAQLMHPDDVPRARESFAQLRRGETSEALFRLVIAGEIHRIHSLNHPIRAEGTLWIVGVARDVTELYAAAEQLRDADLPSIELGAEVSRGKLLPGLPTRIRRFVEQRAEATRALVRERERLVRAIDGNRMGLWDLTVPAGATRLEDLREVWLSPALVRLLGLEPDTTVDVEDWFERIVDTDRPALRRALEEKLAAKRGEEPGFDVTVRIRRGEEDVRSLRVRGALHGGHGAEGLRLTGICWDATEAEQARHRVELVRRQDATLGSLSRYLLSSEDPEKVLKAAALRVREALEADVVVVLQRDVRGGLVVRGSDGGEAARLNGRRFDRFTASLLVEALDQASTGALTPAGDLVGSLVPLLQEEGVTDGLVARIPGPERPFGLIAALDRRSRAPRPGEREFLDAVALVLGQTLQRQRAEASLLRSREHARHVFESDLTANYVADRAGRIRAHNRAFAEVFGVPGQGGPATTAELFEDEGVRRGIEHIMEMGERVAWKDVRLRAADGTVREVLSNFLPDDGGGHHGFLLDMTERHDLQRSLQHSQRLESLGRLAGGVAHDFNNLLTVIHANLLLVLGDLPDADPQRRHLEEVHRAAVRASDLSRRLLAFGRKQLMGMKRIDLREAVEESMGMLSRLIGEGITIETTLPPRPCVIVFDPTQLEQVLVNLIVNARDAMPHGGRIRIAIEPCDPPDPERGDAGSWACLSVVDEGHGIPFELQSKIFDPFFTTKEAGGSGLGLATVYGIVTQAGGEVRVESEPGGETTFRLYLPLTDEPAEAPPAPAALTAEPLPSLVLVVEDDETVRSVVDRLLRRWGAQTLLAGSVAEGLSVLREEGERVALVVSDVMLPDGRGTAMIARARDTLPTLPVLYMSGYSPDEMDAEMERAEGLFLAKPFTPAELREQVTRAVRHGRAVDRRLVCAWCEAVVRDGEPRAPVSHGLCAACAEEEGFHHLTAAAGEAEIDHLPFGLIQLDLDGRVVAYNWNEARRSGLAPEGVVGRHFFEEVAPCTQVRDFQGRFRALARPGESGRRTLDFIFAMPQGPLPVHVKMVRSEGSDRISVLVRDRDPASAAGAGPSERGDRE